MHLIPPAVGEERSETVREPRTPQPSWAGQTTAKKPAKKAPQNFSTVTWDYAGTTEAAGFVRNSGGKFQQVAMEGQSL